MAMPSSERFRESTRGRVLALLRRADRTIEELAVALKLSDNAIRAHMATLERDGLVRQQGVRRGPGAGKPAVVYALSDEGDVQQSRAYAPVLAALLLELSNTHSSEEVEALLGAVGKRLAASAPRSTGDREARVRSAVELLNALGGDAVLEKTKRGYLIRGCGCPLSSAVTQHPGTCEAIRSLLTDITGAEVVERCDRSGRPRCCFTVPAA